MCPATAIDININIGGNVPHRSSALGAVTSLVGKNALASIILLDSKFPLQT